MEVESRGKNDDVIHVENNVAGSNLSPMNIVMASDLARASRSQAENIYVSKSSKVQIGPKFVSVTQNMSQNEVVKVRLFGLGLLSSKAASESTGASPGRGCRCSVVVFVCWALIVICVLCALILIFVLPQHKLLDIGLHAAWYLRRADWQAMPAYSTNFLQLPVRIVVIGHSGLTSCDDRYSCIERVLEVQQDHLRRDYDDIGPNFLVGGKEGLLFEGRGANLRAAVVRNWNYRILSVMFIGDFSIEEVESLQREHLQVLLEVLVNEGVLVNDYVVYGHCQIQTEIISPGRNLMDMLVTFSHWSSVNASRCLRTRSRLNVI